jgi:hypothetical protein
MAAIEKSCPGCGDDILVNEGVEFTDKANWCRRCGGTAPLMVEVKLRRGLAHLITEASEEKDRIADPDTRDMSPATIVGVDDCGTFTRITTRGGGRYVVTLREET